MSSTSLGVPTSPTSPTIPEGGDDSDWKMIQKNVFTRWCNERLKVVKIPMDDLAVDLQDGTKFVALVQVLSHKQVGRYNKKPRIYAQKMENVQMALDLLMKVEKIKIVNIGSGDIVNGDLKLTLGLIWTLILHYQISIGFGLDKSKAGAGASAKQVLIDYVKDFVPCRKINNFTTDWNDGTMVAALVDAQAPGLLPEAYSMKPENALENATHAMTLAKDWLGVPMVLLPEDIVNPNIDALSVITYVSQFPEAKLKPGAPIKETGDPSKVKVYGDGLKKDGLSINDIDAEFFVDISEAGDGPLKVEIINPQGLHLHPKIDFDESKKIFSYKYTPGEDGEYKINILWWGKVVPNSPYMVNVTGSKRPRASTLRSSGSLAGAASAIAQYKVYGPGIESKVLTALAPTEFWVEGVPTGSKLQVKITGPKGSLTSNAYAVESVGKGKFSVVYRPPYAGKYMIDLTVAGKAVCSSPYSVNIGESNSKIIGWARGPGVDGIGLQVGKATWFKTYTPSTTNKDIVVTVEDPRQNKVNVTSAKMADGVFKYNYTPKTAGEYKIGVLLGPKKAQQRLRFSVTVPTESIQGPCKVWGPGLAPRGIQVGRPSYIYARPAQPTDKKDIIAVKVTGPDGNVPVTDDECIDDVHAFTYEPTKVGSYTIAVEYEDKPVPDFPVVVNVTDVSKVKLAGSGVDGNPIPVNKPACIEVDMTEAGVGQLECQIASIDALNPKDEEKYGAKMAPNLVGKGNGKAEIQFTPKMECKPTLVITYDDLPVPQSPLKLNILDKKPVKAYGRGIKDGVAAGKPTFFMVDAKESGPGALKVDIAGPQKPTVRTSSKNKVYKCQYTPKKKGDYTANITYGDVPAENNPFKFKVMDEGTPQSFAVYGPAIDSPMTVGTPAEFFLDQGDEPVNETAVAIETPTTEACCPTKEPFEKNITKCSFTPREPGNYKLGVKANGKDVPGSPFTSVADFPDEKPKVVASGDGLDKAYVDEWNEFTLEFSREGPGAIGVSIDGPQKVETKVEKQADKKAVVKYLPPKKGDYSINVQFSDEEIPGSPFKVKAVLREEESGVTKLVQLATEGLKVGDNFNYKVDTSAIPDAKVAGKIFGPFAKDSLVPAELLSDEITLKTLPKVAGGKRPNDANVKQEGKSFTLSCQPKQIGVYVFYAFVGDRLAPKTPQKIFVCDPSKVKITGCGLKDSDKSFDINKPLNWKADCTKAGPGTLKAYCGGPDSCSETFTITPEPGKEDCYSIDYVPDRPGSYQILFAYSGYDLPTKPVLMVGDSSKAQVQASGIKTCLVNEEVSFRVDLSAAGAGKLSASLEGPAEVPISFSKNNDGTCNFTFAPPEVGKYALSVSFGDKLLTDKPLEVIAINPDKVKISGSGVTGKGTGVGKPAKVIVDCKEAGEAPVVQATLTKPGAKTDEGVLPLQFTQPEEDEPIFVAEYIPDEIGVYNLDVKFADKPVKGSPFKTPIADPEKVKLSETKPIYAKPGETAVIDCFTDEAGPGELTAAFVNPKDPKAKPKPIPVRTMKDKPGHYQIPIEVEPDVQNVEVCYNDVPVSDIIPVIGGTKPKTQEGVAPLVQEEVEMELETQEEDEAPMDFSSDKPATTLEGVAPLVQEEVEMELETQEEDEAPMDFSMPPSDEPVVDPKQCFATGPGVDDEPIPAGTETFFTVDSTEGGKGIPSVTISGPEDSKVEPVRTEEKPGVNKFTYTPEKGGPHEVAVKIGDEDIPGSPFTVPVCNPAGVKFTEAEPDKKQHHPGDEIELTVDLKDAGPGDFNLGCIGPGNTPIVSEEALIDTTDELETTPEDDGRIVLKPDGPKVGSTVPFSINTAGVKTGDVITGRAVGPFDKKSDIPDELLSDKVKLDTLPTVAKGQNIIEPEVTEENKVYDVKFIPEQPGVYILDIFLGNNPIDGMPKVLNVCDPDKVIVTGPGLGSAKGKTYPHKKPLSWEADCSKAGPGCIKPFRVGPDGCSKKFKINPVPGKPSTFNVTYKPNKSGPYQVLFTFGGYETPYKPSFSAGKPSLLPRVPTTDEETDDVPDTPAPVKGKINQKKNDDGTYTLGFTPDKPGVYEFNPTIAGVPISEEPLSVLVTDPNKVEVSGPSLTGKGDKAGTPTDITVDRTDAGPAPIEGVLSLPSGEKQPLDFQPKDESKPDVLSASFTPEEPGEYPLDLTFGGEPLPDSPYTAKIVDDKTVTFDGPGLDSAAIGEENVIDLFMPEIIPEECTMELMAPDHHEIPLDFIVDKVDDDHCQIKFTPEVEGECEGQLKYAGKPIGDPFKLPIGDPSKCTASGPGIEEGVLPVGQETSFTVDSTEAGPGKPKVVVEGPEESKITPECTEEKPGVNKYTYTPEKGGPHEVSVLFGGHDIPGSPFHVPVCNPAGVKFSPQPTEKPQYHPGDEIVLDVDLKDAGECDFNLGLFGPDDQPIVSEDAIIAFVPLDEAPIDGNTEVIQLTPEGPKVGSTIPYKIDTSRVQTGDVITGKVIGPFKNKKSVPKKLLSDKVTLSELPTVAEDQPIIQPDVKEENKVYDVDFTPEEVGVYALYVFLGENLVNDMPKLLVVSDPSKVIITGPGLRSTRGNIYPKDENLEWDVDCTKAGPGSVSAFCAGPDDCSKKFKISPVACKPDCYTVKYKPKKAGPYQVLIAYGGYETSDKPTFNVSKPSLLALLFGRPKGDKETPAEEEGLAQQPEEGNINQKKNDDGTYSIGFVPEKPGEYKFKPKAGDIPVLEEPLTVLVTDPDKVEVCGPSLSGEGARAGKPTEVTVDRTDAGPAPVEGVLSLPSGEKQPLDFQPKDESKPDVLSASFTPEEPGEYPLDIKFGEEPLPKSPYTANIVDNKTVTFDGPGLESAAIGEENVIDLFMPEIVPEECTMELMAPDHHEIPLDFIVDKVDDDHCQIKFTPEVEGECEGQLKYAGKPIGDPFKLPIGDPNKCTASGPGIEEGVLPVGQETSFTVDSTEAGPGKPKVVVEGPEDSKITPECTEEKPGVNKYTYTPEKGGPHEVSVLFGGHDIPGSPFHVPVCNPAGVKFSPQPTEKPQYHPGDEIVLDVDLKDAGECDFNLGLVGPDDQPIVSEDAIIAFVPLDEAPIDGNTEVIQLTPEGPKVGSTIPYKIDTSGVETGDVITGKVVGPFKNKKSVPKKLLSDKITLAELPTVAEDQPIIQPDVKEENKVYDVDFTPEEVGVYALYVFLGENLVNDMPTLLVVSDPSKVIITGPGLRSTRGNTYPKDEYLEWDVDCTKAGPGSVSAFCAGPDDCSKKFKISPVACKPDCYTVKYKPKKAGPYQVLIAYGGYETSDKPTFNVSKPSLLALLFGRPKGDKETPAEEEGKAPKEEPKPQEGKINQKQNEDGTYSIGFVPEKPGLYEFNPTVGDSPVLEEPLAVLVTDPDKVEVCGPSLSGEGARAGKPTEVTVDRTDAGPAPVEGVLSLPSGEKQPLDFQPKDESKPDVLSASFTPEEPGEYPLDIKFGEEPLPKSPYTANIVDNKTVTFDGPGLDSAAIGEENVIDLFMPEIVPEECTMELMAPDHHEIPLDFIVDKVDDDHCQIKFTPEVEGECEGQLKYAGKPIGDPFKLPIGDPSKCTASGPGIEEGVLPVGQETSFTVDSTEAGPGKPKVVVEGPEDSKITPECTEEKPGVNKYTYTPEKGGPHEVSVLFGGHDVPGSPFHVPVCNPAGVKFAPLPKDRAPYHPGDEIVLDVDLKDAGECDFNLGLVGPDDQPIVSEDAIIAFVPLDEAPIDGNTEVIQLTPEGPKVGSTIPYKIDTSGVETGDVITGKVVGPFKNKKSVPKKLLSDKITLSELPTVAEDQPIIQPDVKEENKVYDVDFTPEEVGVYALYVFLGENLVNDMPTLLVVSDPSKVIITGPGLRSTRGNTYPKDEYLEWDVDCTKAGPGSVSAFCAGPDDCSKKFKISPVACKPDCYTVKYKPKKAGPYQVLIAYGGYETSDKPTFNVSKPSLLALLFGRPKGDKETPAEEEGKAPKEEPKPQEGKISQKQNDDGTYSIGFVPEKPGLYEFNPTVGDSPVLEEPLAVLVTDPDKVEVCGPSLSGEGARAGKPTEVTVDRTDAGPAPVEGVLSLPSGEKQPLDFQPKDKSKPDVLSASFTPEEPGEYPLDLTFGGEPLPDSPYTAKIVDDKTVTFDGPGLDSAAIGEENVIDLFMPEIVPEECTMELMAPDHHEIPLDFIVDKVDDDHCQIKFTPEVEGECEGQLKYAGKPIGDPFKLPIGDPSKCTASGPGIEEGVLPVGQETSFTVDSTEAGPGKPKVVVEGPEDSKITPECTEEKPGVNKYTYTPEKGGPHEVSVLFGGHDVPGSPFHVPVCNPAGVKFAPLPKDRAPYHPGDEIVLDVDLKDAGECDFNLGLVGPDDQPIVSEDAIIAFVPLDEAPIDGNTEVIQLTPEGPKVGSTIPYKIDTSGVETGDVITGKVVGPFKNKKSIPKKLLSDKITLAELPTIAEDQPIIQPDVKEENKVYDVDFTPEEVGVYALYVFLGENLVNDMPTLLVVSDPSKVIITGPGLRSTRGNTYPKDEYLEWDVDCTKAGPGSVSAFCAGPDDCSKKFKISPVACKPDCYTVKYKPKKAGPYQVLIAYGGYETSDKPTFNVSKPSLLALLFGRPKGDKETPAEEEGKASKEEPKPQEGKINQKQNDDGTYSIGFVPEKPGLYEFNPTVGDTPVLEEPLAVLVTDPDKVEVCGPSLSGEGARAGKPTEVTVDRTDAGPAPVEGVLSLPSGEKQPLDFQPKDESKPDVLSASFTPEEPGEYPLDLTFGGEPLPDSPYTAKIVDDKTVTFDGPGLDSAAIGEENVIDLFMPEIVPEECTMELMAPDHHEIPLDFIVDKVDDDHCQIKFTPEVEGECEGQLKYAGKPVGDPFKLPIGDPSKCTASGPGIEEGVLPVGQETSFTVDSTEAGPGKPKVVVEGPEDSKITPECTEEKPGVNKYTYTPEKGGPHEVSVLFGGHDIPGSPFHVPVCNPTGVKFAPLPKDKTPYHPGDEIVLDVDLKDAGECDFNLGLVGPDDQPIVSEDAIIAFVPLDEAPIDGNTEVIQLTPEGPKVGSTIPYKIDTSGVETGDVITGKVVGPFKNKKSVPKKLLSDKITLAELPTVAEDQPIIQPDVKEENKVFDVDFTPEEVGVYALYVFLGENLVNDMPTLLVVSDPSKVIITGPGLRSTRGNTYPKDEYLVWDVDCTKAGPGSVSAFCAGPDDCSKKFKISPVASKPDCYTVKYKPKKAGPYQVLIAYGGYETSDKPTFNVSKPSLLALLFGRPKADKETPTEEEGKAPKEEPKPQEGKINQKQNDDGTYSIGFVPEKPGLYEFNPTVGDTPVLEEPLAVLVTDPDKVEVCGPSLSGEGARAGKPTEVTVDRTDAGPAPVEGVLSLPSGEKQPLDFQPKDENKPDILSASFTPEEPGEYPLDLTFGEEPLPDSPYTAKVVDDKTVTFDGPGLESAAIGEENVIDLFMPEIVPEECTMELMAPDHHEIPLDFIVDKVDDDHCQIKFTPEVEGECEGQLKYAGKPVGDPFKLPIGDPNKCTASGPGIEEGVLPVGQETSFTVDSTEAGPGKPKVVVEGPEDSKITPECTEEKPGVNKYTYTPEKGGPHEVSILFGGHDVPGSPFHVPVCNPAGVKFAPLPKDKTPYHPGDEIVLDVDLKDAGECDFSLGLVGPDDQPIVSEDAVLAFVPLDEEAIDGNTEVIQLTPEGPKVGSTIPYKIDTSGVETGDVITGKVVGPFKNKKSVPKKLLSDKITLSELPTVAEDQPIIQPDVNEENKVYDVDFTPEEVGVYALYVFLGENLVNDMPTLLVVSDPSKVIVSGPGLAATYKNTYPKDEYLEWDVDCTKAGPGSVSAFCAGPDDCSKKFKINPVACKPDCYTVKYKPKKAGPYQVLIAYGGYETSEKPTFNVSKPSLLALLFGRLKGDDETPEEKTKEPEKGKIRQTKNDDGTYSFGFVPEKPGLYEFNPTVGDTPIFEEPLAVLVTDPDKVEVCGPSLSGEGARAGKPTEVTVDRTDAGPAPVEGVLSLPSGEKQPLDFQPKDESKPDVLSASFTPEEPGEYPLDVMFGGEPLPDSPYTAKVVDNETVTFDGPGLESAAIGEENVIDLFMPEIVPEECTMELMAPDHHEIPLDFIVDKVDDDHCQIKFTPEVEGECEGQLKYAGKPVGDPFKLPIGDPSKCTASGPGVEENAIPAGSETFFTVDSTKAGPGNPKVTIRGPEDERIEPTCTEEKPGVNKYTYTPEKGGPHEVEVLYGGHDIPGSPFTVPVVNPAGIKCKPVIPEKPLRPGDPFVLTIDLRDAGNGDFNLGLIGPDKKPIVSEDAVISFVPVEETPIDFKEVPQPKPEGPKVGSTIPYSIDSAGVKPGDAALTGRVIGPYPSKMKVPKSLLSSKIPLQSLPETAKDQNITEAEVKLNDGELDIYFSPENVGIYVVYIYQGDSLVDNMPYLVTVCDPDYARVIGPGLEEEENKEYLVNRPLAWEAYCTEAGNGELTASCEIGPDGCSKNFKISPIPCQANSYIIEYYPTKEGDYLICFNYGGYEMSCKPKFRVTRSTAAPLEGRSIPTGDKTPVDETCKLKPQDGKLESTLDDDGKATFKFTPRKPGLYQVMPTMQDYPVLQDPVSILVTDPEKVKVFGPGVTGKGLCIGKPTEVFLDRTNSGPGPVKGVLSTPSGFREPIEFEPKEDSEDAPEPNVLVGRYTPQISGVHTLSILFDNEALPISPLKVYAVDPNEFKLEGGGIKEATVGKVNIIDCLLENMPEDGVFSMVTEDESGVMEPLPCETIQVNDEECSIQFQPDTESARYAVLQFNDVPITSKIALAPNNIEGSEIIGLKQGQGVLVNKEKSFKANFSGCLPTTEKLSVQIIQSDGSMIQPLLMETSNRYYRIFFKPTVLGMLRIIFLYGDQEMVYTVFVIDPSAVVCTGLGGESTLVSEKQVFAIDTTAAGVGAQLRIELEGEDGGSVSCKHMINNNYSGVLSVMLAGTYYVHIYYGGYAITGSPFECNFHRLDPDASRCSITDFLSTPGKFMVDCREAGGLGKLEVAVYGGYVPARYIGLEHNGDYTFNIEYDIPDPIETFISCKWHGEHLAGSPFKVVFK